MMYIVNIYYEYIFYILYIFSKKNILSMLYGLYILYYYIIGTTRRVEYVAIRTVFLILPIFDFFSALQHPENSSKNLQEVTSSSSKATK